MSAEELDKALAEIERKVGEALAREHAPV
jgi:hypothetical protein